MVLVPLSTIIIPILIVVAYLIASVSSAIIVCKLMNLPDPCDEGSSNANAIDVLDVGGKLPAALTLLGDFLKGVIPVLIGMLFGLSGFCLGLIAVAAILGHIFPIYFKFEGGRAITTFFGGLVALNPLVGIAAIITWLIVFAVARYISVASLISAVLAILYTFLFGKEEHLLPIIMMSALIIWRHRKNIQRLYSKTEDKFIL